MLRIGMGYNQTNIQFQREKPAFGVGFEGKVSPEKIIQAMEETKLSPMEIMQLVQETKLESGLNKYIRLFSKSMLEKATAMLTGNKVVIDGKIVIKEAVNKKGEQVIRSYNPGVLENKAERQMARLIVKGEESGNELVNVLSAVIYDKTAWYRGLSKKIDAYRIKRAKIGY